MMLNWINSHGIEVMLIYYAFSAVVSGMPTRPEAGWAYQWFFSTMHILSGSIARLIATQLPNSKIGQQLTGAKDGS